MGLPQIDAFQTMVSAANVAVSGGFTAYLWWDETTDITLPALVIEELGNIEWNYFVKGGTINFDLWDTYNPALPPEQNLSLFSGKVAAFIDAFWALPITEGYIIKPRFRITEKPNYGGPDEQSRLCYVSVACDFGLNE